MITQADPNNEGRSGAKYAIVFVGLGWVLALVGASAEYVVGDALSASFVVIGVALNLAGLVIGWHCRRRALGWLAVYGAGLLLLLLVLTQISFYFVEHFVMPQMP